MGEIPSGNRRSREHGKVLGQFQSSVCRCVEQVEQGGLLRVVRAGGIAGRWPDAPVPFTDQVVISECLVFGITPEFLPYPFVQVLGKGFRKTVRQGLDHDGVVIVVAILEFQ